MVSPVILPSSTEPVCQPKVRRLDDYWECALRCRRYAGHLRHSFKGVNHRVRLVSKNVQLTQADKEHAADCYQQHINGPGLTTIGQRQYHIAR